MRFIAKFGYVSGCAWLFACNIIEKFFSPFALSGYMKIKLHIP